VMFAVKPRVRLSIHTACALTRERGAVGLLDSLAAAPEGPR
jgi:hypothetical protein